MSDRSFTPDPSSATGPDAGPQAGLAMAELGATLERLEDLAQALEGQPELLLSLLRRLEKLHRTIQDGPFRASLPAERNALFQLLSEMERSGGWPYIPRLQLRTFLDLLGQGAGAEGLALEGSPPLPEPPGQGNQPPLAA